MFPYYYIFLKFLGLENQTLLQNHLLAAKITKYSHHDIYG